MEMLDLNTAMLLLEKLDPISVTNAKGEYIYANSTWLDTFSLTPEKLVGLHPWDILPDTMVREVLQTHEPIIAHSIKTKNGTGFVSYYPLKREDEFFGVLIMVLFTGMEIALKVTKQVTQLSKE